MLIFLQSLVSLGFGAFLVLGGFVLSSIITGKWSNPVLWGRRRAAAHA